MRLTMKEDAMIEPDDVEAGPRRKREMRSSSRAHALGGVVMFTARQTTIGSEIPRRNKACNKGKEGAEMCRNSLLVC